MSHTRPDAVPEHAGSGAAALWAPSSPERPRRRALPWIVAFAIVVVLAVAAWFIGEWIARDLVSKTIRQQVITQLSLPADQKIDVELQGAVLPQLIAGTLQEVTVSSDRVALGSVTGDVVVRAEGVPVRGDAAARSASATLSLDAAQVQSLLSTVPGFPASSVQLADPNLSVDTQLTVFGAAVPVGVSLTPSAADGALVLTPTGLRLAGAEVSADDLRRRLGGLAGGVLKDWTVCVAKDLPAGVRLTGVSVTGQRLVADLAIDGRIVVDPQLQQVGTCA